MPSGRGHAQQLLPLARDLTAVEPGADWWRERAEAFVGQITDAGAQQSGAFAADGVTVCRHRARENGQLVVSTSRHKGLGAGT